MAAAAQLIMGQRSAPDWFLGLWLIGWTIAGGFAWYTWLWMLRGREIILLRADALVVKRDVFGFGRAREYDLQQTRNLRVAAAPADRLGARNLQTVWDNRTGPIAFDYGSKTVRVGSGLDEAEAQEIVSELKSQHAFS